MWEPRRGRLTGKPYLVRRALSDLHWCLPETKAGSTSSITHREFFSAQFARF